MSTIDYNQLKKNDFIPRQEIENWSGRLFEVDQNKFRLAALRLLAAIEKARPDLAGHIKTHGCGLLIQEDTPAAAHLASIGLTCIRRLKRVSTRFWAIDRSVLPEHALAKCDLSQRIYTAAAIEAARAARREKNNERA